MGVIQSGINQLLQTTAIGVAGAKKVMADADAVKNEAATNLPKVEQELMSTHEQLNENKARLSATKSGLDVSDRDYDPVTGKISGTHYGALQSEEQAKVKQSYDTNKLGLAKKVLMSNLEAKSMQREQYLKVLGKKKGGK